MKIFFIGIDVSKLTLDVALYSINGNEKLNHLVIENNPDGFKKMISWIKKKRIDPILLPALNFYLIMIILSITVAGASRLSNYFIFFFFMAAINTFLTDSDYKLPKVRSQMIVILALLVISKSFYYTRDMSKYNYGREAHFYNIYLPYHSVFDPIIDTRRENIFRNSMEENVK